MARSGSARMVWRREILLEAVAQTGDISRVLHGFISMCVRFFVQHFESESSNAHNFGEHIVAECVLFIEARNASLTPYEKHTHA